MVNELHRKTFEYAKKHDLSYKEYTDLHHKLVMDRLEFGNAFLDMEEGRQDPREVDE